MVVKEKEELEGDLRKCVIVKGHEGISREEESIKRLAMKEKHVSRKGR